jgi:hypothetical protein
VATWKLLVWWFFRSLAGLEVNLPKSGDESQVQVEDVLQPLNGGGGLVGQDLDEVGTSLVTG